MRKLNTTDVFTALRLIRKGNLKSTLIPYMEELTKKEADLTKVGIDGFLTLIEIFAEHQSEQALYDFLSGPFEMTAEDIGKMDLWELIDKLKEFREVNNLERFFTALRGLMKEKS